MLFGTLLLVQCGYAQGNLALHKSYTLAPAPNYNLCSDPDDDVQLTDGVIRHSDWFKKTTVGWSNIKSPVVVELDLGMAGSIEEIVLYSIGGGAADVEYPFYIAAFGSMNRDGFYSMGLIDNRDLSSLRTEKREKISQAFRIRGIRCDARYIRLILMLNGQGNHFFLDEIEVLGRAKTNRAAVSPFPDQPSDPMVLAGLVNRQALIKDMASEMFNYADRSGIKASEPGSQLVRAITDVIEPLKRSETGLYSKARLDQEFQRLSILRSKLYKLVYKSDLVLYPSNAMEILRAESFLSDGVEKTDQPVDLALWQNEYESASVNVINCTESTMHLNMSISPVTDQGGQILTVSPVTFRRPFYVYAATAGFVGDPLILLGDGFDLEPGEASQIWLTWYSREAGPGQYNFTLAMTPEISGQKLPIQSISAKVRVYPVCFPEQASLKTCNWSYTSVSYMTDQDNKAAAQDLKSHYTNVYAINHNILPWPKKVAMTGDIETHGDFARLDSILQQHAYARTFLVYMNLKSTFRDSFGKTWMSSSWKRAFSQWLRALVTHLKDKGLSYDRFALYPFDEQLGDEFYELAGLIRQIDPNVRIYANSFGGGPGDFMRLRDLVDIWCLQLSLCDLHRNWLETVKGFGKEIWTYEAQAPAKSFSPYAYYRLMSWQAFELGLTGAGFWTYVNHQKTSGWDDTGVPLGFYNAVYREYDSPVDTLGERIIPSRRWEAWREGVEDYQYCWEFKKAIALKRQTDPAGAALAQDVLNDQVTFVLENAERSDCVYAAREKITEALLRLMDSPQTSKK